MRRQKIPIYQTTLLLVNLSLIYFGYSFTYGTLHFDEIAYFFIYYAFVTRLPIIQFFCILLAIFTDERSVISIFLASLIFMNSQKNITIRSIYPIIYLILVIVIREIISVNFEIGPKIQHGGIILFQLIREFRITNITIGFFGTFKLLWIFIIFYFTQLWKQTSRYIAFAILSLTLIYTGASFSVIDTTRTLTYLFPLLLFPIYLNGLPDNIRISNIKVKTQDMLILNILIP
jgi:hypothetical protein